jgi:hypothetical protein
MSEREQYPAGVPPWVETLQPDPRAALDFYGTLFGSEFAGPGPMPGDPPGEYYVARCATVRSTCSPQAARCSAGGPSRSLPTPR